MFGVYKGITDNNYIGDLKHSIFSFPTYMNNYFQADISDVPTLEITIKKKEYNKVKEVREKSLERGILRKDINKYSKAKFTFDGKEIKGKLKLKGIFKDHWENDKEQWSYKVKLSKENEIFGLRVFSLMKPVTRKYLNDWYYDKLLKFSGQLHQNQNFVNVTLNGKDLGIYILEERHDKKYLERHNLKGSLFKIDKAGLMNSEFFKAEYNNWMLNSKLKIVAQTDSLYSLRAMKLFDQFRMGEIIASDCFDIKTYAWLMAISDVSGTWHEIMPHNTLFYYNPKSDRIELVGDDGSFSTNKYHIRTLLGSENSVKDLRPIDMLVSKDTSFYSAYYKALCLLDSSTFISSFIKATDEEYKKALSVIYDEHPLYEPEQIPAMEQNQIKINYILGKSQNVRAFKPEVGSDSIVTLDISLPSDFPVVITGGYNKNQLVTNTIGNVILFNNPEDQMKVQNVKFENGYSNKINQVGYKIIGSDSLVLIDVEAYNLR